MALGQYLLFGEQIEFHTLSYFLPQYFLDSTEEENLPPGLHFQQPRAILLNKLCILPSPFTHHNANDLIRIVQKCC